MLPNNRIATHPGKILFEEFLKPLGVIQVTFAHHIEVPLQRVNEIIRGKRGITSETTWFFSEALGTTPQFWINLQDDIELTSKRPQKSVNRLITTTK
ncbi:MAG: HigA family addiction module antitoxin [Dehalococcoidales bacterium]|nr:HigA family addiction module antitoxin [Dehalococcoidales bacterium]